MGFYIDPIDNRYGRQNLYMNTSSQKSLLDDYERRMRAPMNPGGTIVNPEGGWGGKPWRPMPGNNSMTPYDWKNDPNNLIMELNAGVDFGNMTAMAGKKTGKRAPLAMVPGNVVAPNVPEHTGHSNDMFKEDPYRSYNSGYRYNAHGLQPLYFG